MKHSSNGNETDDDDDDDKNDDNDDDLCSVCAISAAPVFCKRNVTYALSATHGKSWIRRMPLVQKRRVELLHTRWSQ